jgi:hypothetical protein
MSPTAPTTTISPTLRRRRGLTEQAAVAAVDQACRRLRLPTIRAVLDEALTVPADARSRGALRTYACNAGGPAPKGAGPPAQTVPGNAGAVVVQPAPRSGPPAVAGPWGGTGHPRLYPAASSVSSASSVTSTAPPSFRSR